MHSLAPVAKAIDRFNDILGRGVAWLALTMVLVQFIVVVLRYVFGIGSIFLQESIVYMHGFNFLLGAGYTLLHDGHVRVDIFYREAPVKRKALTDLIGVGLFLLPVCIMIFWVSFPYVADSWANLEGSQETSGIPGVFVLKTSILLFSVVLILQGISMAIHACLVLLGAEAPVVQEQHEGL